MNSVWSDGTSIQSFNKLRGDVKTDVLIVGGGMAGILCAYFLAGAGVDYILVEAKKIGCGITKNTTAKITSQHGLIYSDLIKNFGFEKAKKYLTVNQAAIEEYRRLSQRFPCDFEEKPAFVYSIDNKGKIEKEVEAVNKLGFKSEFAENIPIPVKVEGAVKFGAQAQFNPLQFIEGVSRGLNIYEDTFIKNVDGNTALFDGGKITAEKVIIATHFPFINTHGSYFLKMYQHRSYVIALENAQNADGMYVDEKETGMSFRNYRDLLLVGGGDHRTGKQGGGWEELRGFAKNAYPNAAEKYAWATQDCMTLDGIPYIGRYSKSTRDLYVAAGFSKWGMTSSMVSAMILSDMVMGRENEFCDIFSPSRTMMRGQLLVNAFEAVTNLLSFSTKRCTHLGCSLKWNKLQRSWDCPCHGSRFGEHGNIIDNPAMKGIKVE